MSEIRRYALKWLVFGDGPRIMAEYDGSFVLYTDHIAALEAVKHDLQTELADMTSSRDGYRDDIEAVKATVKPLEWEEIDLRVGVPPMVIWAAKTPFANYELESVMGRPWFCSFICAHFSSLDDAKAAAQADYEQRVLSAFVPSPALEANQQVIETLREERNKFAMYCHSLVAEIEYLQEATGETLDDEDADMVRHISEEASAISPLTSAALTPPTQDEVK